MLVLGPGIQGFELSPGPGQDGKTQASQPAKMKRHELVVGRVFVKGGFVMKEEGSG